MFFVRNIGTVSSSGAGNGGGGAGAKGGGGGSRSKAQQGKGSKAGAGETNGQDGKPGSSSEEREYVRPLVSTDPAVVAVVGAEPPPEPPAAGLNDPKTFLELVLTAPDGTALANQPFIVEIAGEPPVEGKTDASGKARIEDLRGKSCLVRFPEVWADELKD